MAATTNKNVSSAVFDGVTIADPRNFRVALEGATIEDSAGADTWVKSNDLVRRRCAVQLSFGSLATAIALIKRTGSDKFGVKGTITLGTETLGTSTTTSLTIADARLVGIVMDAQHADVGAHILTFVAYGDNNQNPIT